MGHRAYKEKHMIKLKPNRHRFLRLGTAVAGVGALVAAQAGTVTLNFSTNPATDGTYVEPGDTSAEWRQDGGASGANGDGYLSVNDARAGQRGVVLFKDLEPGLVVKAFTFECDLRIGGGHNNPADGFSLNYVRDTDPIVANIEAGSGNPFAGTDSENGYGADSDSGPGTGNGLPEEGCSTGLAIGFDTWQSATINGVQDVVGLSIRVDSKLIAQLPVPLKPGNIFLPTMPNPGAQAGAYEYDAVPYRNLPKSDANYASSMQTGALSDEDLNGDGVVDAGDQTSPQPIFGDPSWGLWVKNLNWEKFKAELTEEGAVKVWWKGVELTPEGGIPTDFAPSPGRIVFAARTGDNFEVHHVDNIVLTTIPADNVIIGNATGSPIGFSVLLIDSGPAVVNPDTIALKLDGVDVTRTGLSKTGGNTTVSFFDVTKPLAAGSVHTVQVTVRDTRGNEITDTKEFTVPAYVTLPAEYAVAGVSQPGFNVAVHQTATRNQETTIARAEQQLQGLRGANVADLTGFVGGVYAETGVINYSQLAAGIPEAAGVFQENNGFPDASIPGIPSATEVNPDGSIYTDNIAAEIVTYLQFPAPGVYNIIFNSDDGFRTTAFRGAREVLTSLLIGEADVGRGASDTVSIVYVPEAGSYPFRTVWFEGGGGANLEWSAEQTAPQIVARALINDPACAVKAFRSTASASPAVVTFTHPFRNSGNPYLPTIPLIAKVQDGATAVDQNTIKMFLNGTEITTTKTRAGNVTTATHRPTADLPAGNHELKVTFAADGQTYEGMTTFTVRSVPSVPPSFALPAAVVNTANTGFLVKTVQNASYQDLGTRGTDTYAAESQINGLLGLPNTADPASFSGPSGYYVETDVINYFSTGENGYFDAASTPLAYPDYPVPGIPGITPVGGAAFPPATDFPDTGTDSYSQEILTVLNLQPGVYAMNVNSDDGFRAYFGNPREWWTLPLVVGEFDGGRGAGAGLGDGTFFYFRVTQAGFYPFRLLWYEGGGGSSVEWSSRALDADTGHLGDATLVNDYLTASAIKAYQYPLNSPGSPYVKSFAPGRDRTSAASQTRASNDAAIHVVIEQGVATLSETGITLTVDGTAVTPTATKVGTELRVSYVPTTPWADGVHNAVLTYGDRTVSWSFRTGSPFKTPTFFIEAEDFDNNGQGLPVASQMPYMGGAYAGLSATAGTDYQRDDSAPSPLYRHGTNPRVSMDRTGDRNRGLVDIAVNFKLGWIGAGQWYNYTRNFPEGEYNVYAAISNGGTGASDLSAALKLVSGGSTTDLGTFLQAGTGGWGNNALVPLKDASGNLVSLNLSGTQTLRYEATNGDWDFMLLVPASEGPTQPQITGIRRNTDGTITIEWTGGGVLQAGPTVLGPWEDVAGATSPYTFTPQTGILFGRIRQ